MGTKNRNLNTTRNKKNDEFYTRFKDIEHEVMAYFGNDRDIFRGKTILLPCDDPEWSNFTRYFAMCFEVYGIKKLISTSYNKDGGQGKLFTLEKDVNSDGRINLDDLQWEYLTGDGDFNSPEVTTLRDEADVIIANPPFSKFREFMNWIMAGNKKFLILGNKNAVTYKEVWPLIQSNQVWSGYRKWAGGMWFELPNEDDEDTGDTQNTTSLMNLPSIWITNLGHPRRHDPLMLMNMSEVLQYGKGFKGSGKTEFDKYDNYDAIEIPYTASIPSDYQGVMGVPISFLDKYCPEQFEIVGCSHPYGRPDFWPTDTDMAGSINGVPVYKRIFIRHRTPARPVGGMP